MKKNNSLKEYVTPVIELQYEELTVLCTSTGASVDQLIEDPDFTW